MQTYAILHNIRSAHNVGSVFRTADGAGVSKIFLTGYTPAPTDRFGRTDETIEKTALGATHSVAWEARPEIEEVITELRQQDVEIVAVEQDARALDYRSWKLHKDTAFIFGNEIEGVPLTVCDSADTILHIPMHGMKESLNISVSAGVILFHVA
jgi:23S rRNA (guanosine2251-2'-O)-methyltransferase